MNKVILFLISFMSFEWIAAQTPVAGIPVKKHRFIVIAHRGVHTEVPENTLDAFKQGIEIGADFVEIDLRTTKDSVLVIMHDATVDRMTNGTGRVKDLLYKEIKQLEIKDKRDSAKTYGVPGFDEVLATCKNNILIYLDFKEASVQQAYDMIKQYGMQNQVIVYINSAFQYKEWKRLAPVMPLMVSLPGNIKSIEALQNFLEENPVALLDGDYSNYTAAMIEAANLKGVPVWPDIQSAVESDNWDKAIANGFKGLQTDHPKQLIDYLKEKGLR